MLSPPPASFSAHYESLVASGAIEADAAQAEAAEAFADLEQRLADAHPDARIATIGGRYYAMDRDQRWERIARGYNAIVHGVGERASSAADAIAAAYARGENDELGNRPVTGERITLVRPKLFRLGDQRV